MEKIITCASYGGTGSSAITDLLKEFKNCKSFGDYEFTFLHYPDGIRDLELNILNRNNRLNTSYSIYKFLKMNKRIERDYSKYFGKEFIKLTENYVDKISSVSWKGTSELYFNNESEMTKFKYKLGNKIFGFIRSKKEGTYFQKKNYPMFCGYLSEEKFYSETKIYLKKLFGNLDRDNSYKNLVVDQLVPASDINSYLNYFDNIKVIVVDRDPIDLYILNKIIWKEGWIPTEIKEYIKYFKIIREHQKFEKEDTNKVLRVKFEDLIYKYDLTLKKIMKFIGLTDEDHIFKQKFFDPKISIKNTNLKNKYIELRNEIKIIEKELSEFCYNLESEK